MGNHLRHWAAGGKWALGKGRLRHTRAFAGGKCGEGACCSVGAGFDMGLRLCLASRAGVGVGGLDLCRASARVTSCTWTGHGHSRLPSLRRWQVFALMGVPAVAPQPASCSLSEGSQSHCFPRLVRASTSSSGSPRARGRPARVACRAIPWCPGRARRQCLQASATQAWGALLTAGLRPCQAGTRRSVPPTRARLPAAPAL